MEHCSNWPNYGYPVGMGSRSIFLPISWAQRSESQWLRLWHGVFHVRLPMIETPVPVLRKALPGVDQMAALGKRAQRPTTVRAVSRLRARPQADAAMAEVSMIVPLDSVRLPAPSPFRDGLSVCVASRRMARPSGRSGSSRGRHECVTMATEMPAAIRPYSKWLWRLA